jgi:hypothetical protein
MTFNKTNSTAAAGLVGAVAGVCEGTVAAGAAVEDSMSSGVRVG